MIVCNVRPGIGDDWRVDEQFQQTIAGIAPAFGVTLGEGSRFGQSFGEGYDGYFAVERARESGCSGKNYL